MTTQPLSPLTMLLSRHTRRREFITLLGSGAVAWPFNGRASQLAQPEQPVIGFLNDPSPDQWPRVAAAFSRGLGDAGYVEGRNVAFTYRWTAGRRDHLPELAADLARTNVAVIVASGHTAAGLPRAPQRQSFRSSSSPPTTRSNSAWSAAWTSRAATPLACTLWSLMRMSGYGRTYCGSWFHAANSLPLWRGAAFPRSMIGVSSSRQAA